MTRRRRAKQQETTVDINAIPLPVRRGANEVAPVRRINKIGENVALATVKQVFSTRLTSHIRSFVASESQKKEPLTESKFNEKMDELKTNLLERKKVPRGIFEEADNIGKYAIRTISNSLGRNHKLVTEWHQFVEQNFPDSYGNEWKEYLEAVPKKVRRFQQYRLQSEFVRVRQR